MASSGPPSGEQGSNTAVFAAADNRASIEWVPATNLSASALGNRALIAGYEGSDRSPLWVIRATFGGALVPGKFNAKRQAAEICILGSVNNVQSFEVCCADPEKIVWVQSSDGDVPKQAVKGGYTIGTETLYVGKAKYEESIIPGYIQPSQRGLTIAFAGEELSRKVYDVLCTV